MKRFRRPTELFLLLVLALLPACERDELSTADRRLSVRLESTFGISLPCSLGWCQPYLDGGTVGGLIVAASGDSLKWAWGRRSPEMRTPKSIEHDQTRMDAWVDSLLKSPPTFAYVGVDHWSRPGGRPLPVGSSAESLFIQLLWYVAGVDTVMPSRVYVEPDRSGQRFRASNVARALQRQRAGKTPLRHFHELSPSERAAMSGSRIRRPR